MAEFNLLTNNTKGLRDEHKRNKIFAYFKSLVKSGIIMFQETHSIEEDLETWTNELGMKILDVFFCIPDKTHNEVSKIYQRMTWENGKWMSIE